MPVVILSIQKRFASRINFCTCSKILVYVSFGKDMSPYNKRFNEGVWYAEIAFISTFRGLDNVYNGKRNAE